jgi:hypothetical protein
MLVILVIVLCEITIIETFFLVNRNIQSNFLIKSRCSVQIEEAQNNIQQINVDKRPAHDDNATHGVDSQSLSL